MQKTSMRKASGDLISGAVLLAIGAYAIIAGVKLGLGKISDPQPGFFPFWSGVVVAILSAALLGGAVLGRCREAEALQALGKPLLMIAGLAAYVAVLDKVGYLIATAALTVILLRVLGTRKWWALLLAAFILAAGSYFLFDRLLNVPLPAGILAGRF